MRFNLKPCENPLHGYHFVGKIHDKDASFIHYLKIITKYMKKTLDLFDNAIKLDLSNTKDSYKILWDSLNSLSSMLDE